MKHKGTIRIETDRLILRKFVASDISAAFRFLFRRSTKTDSRGLNIS